MSLFLSIFFVILMISSTAKVLPSFKPCPININLSVNLSCLTGYLIDKMLQDCAIVELRNKAIMRFTMKNRTFGVSSVALPGFAYMPFCVPEDHPGKRAVYDDAFASYVKERANGTDEDNPPEPLPKDGEYTVDFETIRECFSRIRYTEGPGDHEWMARKDEKYLRQLKRKGQLDIVEPHLEREAPELYAKIVATEITQPHQPSLGWLSSPPKQDATQVIEKLKKRNVTVGADIETTREKGVESSKEHKPFDKGSYSYLMSRR